MAIELLFLYNPYLRFSGNFHFQWNLHLNSIWQKKNQYSQPNTTSFTLLGVRVQLGSLPTNDKVVSTNRDYLYLKSFTDNLTMQA